MHKIIYFLKFRGYYYLSKKSQNGFATSLLLLIFSPFLIVNRYEIQIYSKMMNSSLFLLLIAFFSDSRRMGKTENYDH